MAYNQTGVSIIIKAFLPIGKSLDEQLEALTMVKDAHETSDYSKLLAAATIDEVKTEQKTRRVEDAPAPDPVAVVANASIETVANQNPLMAGAAGNVGAEMATGQQPEPAAETAAPELKAAERAPDEAADDDVPAFLKGKKKATAE